MNRGKASCPKPRRGSVFRRMILLWVFRDVRGSRGDYALVREVGPMDFKSVLFLLVTTILVFGAAPFLFPAKNRT